MVLCVVHGIWSGVLISSLFLLSSFMKGTRCNTDGAELVFSLSIIGNLILALLLRDHMVSYFLIVGLIVVFLLVHTYLIHSRSVPSMCRVGGGMR